MVLSSQKWMSTQQCPKCQETTNVDARFCSNCGTRLPQTSVPAQHSLPGAGKQSQSPVLKKDDASHPSSAPSASATPDDLLWRKHADLWNGFSLECPSGWDVRLTGNAISVCQDMAGLTKAMINAVQLQQGMSADTLARDFVKINQAINETFKAWKMNAQDVTYSEMQHGMNADQVLLRFRFAEEQTELMGVFSVMVDGNSAILSGFQAPPQRIEMLKSVFQRILASFQAETRLPRTEYVEPGKRAFTASVPLGWQATSKLIGTPDAERVQFRASDPQGKMSAELPVRSYIFMEEAKNGWEKQARAAMPHSPATMSYLPAAAFLERVIVPEMQQHSANFQVESIVILTDQAYAAIAESIRQGQPLSGSRPTVASLQGTFTENGVTYRQRTDVRVMPPLPSGPTWIASIGRIVRAPLDQFAQHSMTLEGIIESIQLNQEWLQEKKMRQQQMQQMLEQQQMQLRQQIAANGQALLQGQMQRNQIVRDAQNYAFNVYQGAARNQSEAFHQVNQAFTHNYIQGNEYVHNPAAGVVYDVPVGYRYHWANRMGDVVIASDSPWSPDSDWQPLDPIRG